MPTIDLAEGPKTLSLLDVVGQRAEGETRFVRHVALLNEDNKLVEMGGEASVIHMGPPLEQRGKIKVHVAGRVPLTTDEIKIISTWYKKIEDEYKEKGISKHKQYVIRPPWKDQFDPNRGTRRYRRYSCAGFVLDGHCQVNIELLDIDEDILPAIDRQTIISAYPEAERYSGLLSYWGLEGNGPWKVVLAGYVLHALNRPTDEIRHEPYRAKEGDEQF